MASTARYAHLSLGPVRESVDGATAKTMVVKNGQADQNPKVVQEPPTVADDPVGRLTNLKQMLDSEPISHGEFETKNAEIPVHSESARLIEIYGEAGPQAVKESA